MDTKNKILNIFDKVEEFVALIIFICLIISVTLQVFSRIIGKPLVFTEEISRFLFFGMVFLGISLVTKKRSHIALQFLREKFKDKGRSIFDILIYAFTFVVMCFLLWRGIAYVEFLWNIPATVSRISMGIITIIMPISFFLTMIRCVEIIVHEAIQLKSYKTSEKR